MNRLLTALRELLRRKFVRDTLTLQLGRLVVVGLGMIAWVFVPVRLGPARYGIYALSLSFLNVWRTLNLSGLAVSIDTLLPAAVGARDEAQIRDLLAIFVKVTLIWSLFSLLVLALIGPTLAQALYREPILPQAVHGLDYALLAGFKTVGNAEVGAYAAWLALILIFDPLFLLAQSCFRARRAMRQAALLFTFNQLVLTTLQVAAALLWPTAAAQVAARVLFAVIASVAGLALYLRQRRDGELLWPSPAVVLRRCRGVSLRGYWRFGLANALDKNLSVLFLQLPLQLTGALAGPVAAGYVHFGLRLIDRSSVLTHAVQENMQAVVPQAVGRGDYVRLWRNFRRVLLALLAGGLLVYAALLLLAPLVLVPLFGVKWEPVLGLIPALAVFGLATTLGGIFGPLYRALNLVMRMVWMRVLLLLLLLPFGAWLINALGAVGGVWVINALFLISIGLTALLTLPTLRQRIRAEQRVGSAAEV